MGFEAYTVVLDPKLLPLAAANEGNKTDIQQMAEELQEKWPVIHLDEVELRSHAFPSIIEETCLVYETTQGLFQLLLTPAQGQISVSARFAYCNPRSIYPPFLDVVSWLMENYALKAYVMASDDVPELTDWREIESVLAPSMDYNRRLWQADVGTSQEAALRPGDAIERFVHPRSLSVSLV